MAQDTEEGAVEMDALVARMKDIALRTAKLNFPVRLKIYQDGKLFKLCGRQFDQIGWVELFVGGHEDCKNIARSLAKLLFDDDSLYEDVK